MRLNRLSALAAIIAAASLALVSLVAPAGATNWDPSGQAMPVGNQPGWNQIFADNFANDNLPVGSFTGCGSRLTPCAGLPAGVPWSATKDAKPDTSGLCQYWPSKTLSVAGGVMSTYLHTVGGVCMSNTAIPQIPTGSQTFGQYSVRFRSDAVAGYKGVFLLWADDAIHGEIDFPEGNLDSTIKAFFHPIAGNSARQRFATTATWTAWHTATIQWLPTSITFLLDGKVIGVSTAQIPQGPMHFVIRGESDLQGAPKPPASSAGNLQVDWVTIYSKA